MSATTFFNTLMTLARANTVEIENNENALSGMAAARALFAQTTEVDVDASTKGTLLFTHMFDQIKLVIDDLGDGTSSFTYSVINDHADHMESLRSFDITDFSRKTIH